MAMLLLGRIKDLYKWGWIKQPPKAGASRGLRERAAPGNFEMLVHGNNISLRRSERQTKVF